MTRTTVSFICAPALGLLLAAPPWEQAGSLDPRLESAKKLYREQGAEQALPVFEKLAGEFARVAGDTLGNIGGVHLLLGQFREALDWR